MESLSAPRPRAEKTYSSLMRSARFPSHVALNAPAGKNGETGCPAPTRSVINRASRKSFAPPLSIDNFNPGAGPSGAVAAMLHSATNVITSVVALKRVILSGTPRRIWPDPSRSTAQDDGSTLTTPNYFTDAVVVAPFALGTRLIVL